MQNPVSRAFNLFLPKQKNSEFCGPVLNHMQSSW